MVWSNVFVKVSRVGLLVLLISAFAVGFQVAPVRADPLTINVSPASAPVGSVINVSGVNASVAGEVRVYFFGIFVASTVANESGGYSVDVLVPAIPFDSYPVMALDVASGNASAWVFFSVEPRIVLSPVEGGVNTAVSVKGDGFNSDSDVSILFDAVDVSPLPLPHTDFMGSFTATFNVPYRPNGTYTVDVTDGFGASASALFRVVPSLMVWPLSSSGSHSPGSLFIVVGYGFGADVNVTLLFGSLDITPYPFVVTGSSGYFEVPFLVPDVPDGLYTINATDAIGNNALFMFPVPGPMLWVAPNRVSDLSIVTAQGVGFMPGAPVLLYLQDIMMTNLVDLIWMSPRLMADRFGNFAYSFVVPVTAPGLYNVAAFMMPGPPPAQPVWLASAPLTIIDDSPLNVMVDVGSLHFRGELAEFYVETSLGGKPVDAWIVSANLYWNGTLMQDLTGSVKLVADGSYLIPYLVPSDASFGTYNLVVEANYSTSLVEAFGTGSGSFLLSKGFTEQNAKLIDIQDDIGTIVVPDLGIIKANLTAINARLMGVDGDVATIQSDLGTLETSMDSINAKVVSIDGDVATISSDLGSVMVDASAVKSQVTVSEPPLDMATLALSLVAAVGALLSFVFVRRLRGPSTPASSSSQPPTTPPASAIMETESHVEAEAKPEPAAEMSDKSSTEKSSDSSGPENPQV